MKKSTALFIIFICIATITTRFVNFNWGSPYYFHPDERNIAGSVAQLIFPTQLNPHFFAYGSLPIYIIYFIGLVSNFFSTCHLSLISCHVSFEQAIIISRVLSALFSSGIVYLLYRITQQTSNEATALSIALLSIFCTGLIQFSHFGTFEMWTMFFSLLLCYVFLFPKKHFITQTLLLGIIAGILVSVKVANLVFVPLIILLSVSNNLKKNRLRKSLFHVLEQTSVIVLSILVIYCLTNPYVFIAKQPLVSRFSEFMAGTFSPFHISTFFTHIPLLLNPDFISSMRYETSVATGTLPVFYTQEFMGQLPIVFQLLHVFPFLLNPVLTLLFPLVLLAFFYVCIRRPNRFALTTGVFFLFSFLSQAFLYTKWTRYTVLCLPFFFLLLPGISTYFFKQKARLLVVLSSLLVVTSALYSLSYVVTVYLTTDTRVQAATFAKDHLDSQAPILSEVYDLGITPFNQYFPRITLFNFYDLDQGAQTPETLQAALADSSYIVLPSQRIIKTRLAHPERFPESAAFYQQLVSDKTHYQKIYTTPCTVFCQIVYLGDPVNRFEETASVFDFPIVQIYKKL